MLEQTDATGPSPLPSPAQLKTRLPRGSAARAVVKSGRRAIADVLHGRDARFVVIAGPCSLHDPEAALTYAQRLTRLARETSDVLAIAMRAYVEKPRTALGWKGLVNDPDLDGSCDLALGLERSRRLLLEINELGLPCASEILDPMTPHYIGDLLSWAAIGARTSESQTHRELASGLPMPVGFKNGTSGVLSVACNGIVAARRPHSCFGLDPHGRAAQLCTPGNPDAHLVLRGGAGRTNFSPENVASAVALLSDSRPARPVLVDCSHDNSSFDPRRQAGVCRAILGQVRDRGDAPILGILLESHLRPGRQDWVRHKKLEFGVSITDACIGWEETEALLYEIAEAVVRSKRQRAPDTLSMGTTMRECP